MKRFSIIVIVACWICDLTAQNVLFSNPISLSMAECNASLVNEWSAQTNSAGISRIKDYSFAIMYESRYNLEELSTKGMTALIPTKYGTLGATLLQFGYSDFHTIRGAISYSRMFGENFSAGFQINYWSDYIRTSGNYYTIISDIGIIYDLNTQFTIGIHLFNPEQSSIKYTAYQATIPGIITLAAEWNFVKNSFFIVEMDKTFTEKPDIAVATEVVITKPLSGRIGYSPTREKISGGIRVGLKQLKIDLGFLHQQPLGLISSISVAYKIPSKH